MVGLVDLFANWQIAATAGHWLPYWYVGLIVSPAAFVLLSLAVVRLHDRIWPRAG